MDNWHQRRRKCKKGFASFVYVNFPSLQCNSLNMQCKVFESNKKIGIQDIRF